MGTEDQKKVLDNAKAEDKKAKDFGFLEIKGRKPDNTDPTKMVEVLLFTKLSDAMVAAYDRATLYLRMRANSPCTSTRRNTKESKARTAPNCRCRNSITARRIKKRFASVRKQQNCSSK